MEEAALVLVAAMTRELMTHRRIIDRMRSRCATLRGDALRAPQMQRRFAGYLGAETKADAAVTASFFRKRAQRVALGMTAGSAARTTAHSGSGNRYDAHRFILSALFCKTSSNLSLASLFRLALLTTCSKRATYS